MITHGFHEPAYRFRNNELTPIVLPDGILQTHLLGLDRERLLINRNIERFLHNLPALNILLWGEKGAGKSTVVRLLARDYMREGLRTIEYRDADYHGIYDLYTVFRGLKEYKFLLYFDDVSFDENDGQYRSFKSIVEGGIEEKPSNCLFLATSNRRHLIAENAAGTQDVYDRDIQNEQSSLYARFGLSIGFYPLDRELYLQIVKHYIDLAGLFPFSGWETDAENYAVQRGGRSGRVAQQFIIYHQITQGE